MKYLGGCHCGAVRFEVEMKLERVMDCNCSICAKRGSLLAFAPAGNFTLLRGKEALTDYQFGAKTLHHTFCSTCGILPFADGKGPDGKEMRAINVRCLDNVDFTQFPVDHFDGKHT